MSDFLVIGGDLRFKYVVEYLAIKNDCTVYGLDEIQFDDTVKMISSVSGKFKNIILPLPPTRDNITVKAPLSGNEISLSSVEKFCNSDTKIFAGFINDKVKEMFCDYTLIDYYSDELAHKNAVPTAEGVLQIIMKNTVEAIQGMKILILGNGRTATAITKVLEILNAKATVMIRNPQDCVKAKPLTEIKTTIVDFDIVINTIPAPIIGNDELQVFRKNTLFIDISTPTCLENDINMSEFEINYIHALGIPGNYAPKTAGKLIAEAILQSVE